MNRKILFLMLLSSAFSLSVVFVGNAFWDNTVNLDGEVKKIENGLIDGRYPISISPDGKCLATGCEGGKINIWVKTIFVGWQFVATLSDHKNNVCSIEFSPNSRRIVATTGLDEYVRVWEKFENIWVCIAILNACCGERFVRYSDFTSSWPSYAEFRLDGKQIITHSRNGNKKIWNQNSEGLWFLDLR